ncbi:hemolysin family protein [Demequina mangrovi]|uniref:Hemolysin, contains CBS domains n=1 Tax=Demequina mangrovi TaxID=1043493 RepID=A0A1H6Z330_9MICO|nr:hemolysin family protein [Demequina mangrovi]SEJ45817.1 Hemolysin, contains CBS domains [Demequina mangrovi]
MTEAWLLLLLAIVLIGVNALFVAAEFAFVTVDRPTVDRAAEAGDRRASSLQKGLRKLSTELSGAQLGITVSSLMVGFIAEPSIATLVRVPLESLGLPESSALGVSLALAFLLATGTQMVFGELVPKNWAIAEPLRVGRAVAGAQRGFTWFAGPLIHVLNGAANRIVRAFGMEPREELASARSARELQSLAERSAEQGTLEPRVARRLARAAELKERTASDAMTPRTRVHFLAATDSVADLLVLASRTGHARFPVTGEDVDEIVGVAHFKRALAVPARARKDTPVSAIGLPVTSVPSTMPLTSVLAALREGSQVAVVVDEYGGTDGIVTLEDLVEEIVGEIEDEQDRPVSRHRRLRDGRWSLSGLLRPDEAGEVMGLELPEARESDTLGGLLTERLERFPHVGDTVDLDARDESVRDEDGIATPVIARVRVTRVDGHRVDRVVVEAVPVRSDDESGPDAPGSGASDAEEADR